MIDNDVVAVAAVIAHGGDDAVVAGDDVAAVMTVAVDVHAVVHPAHLSGDRVGAGAVVAADAVTARNRPSQRPASGRARLVIVVLAFLLTRLSALHAPAAVRRGSALGRHIGMRGHIGGIELGDLGVDRLARGRFRRQGGLILRLVLLDLLLEFGHQLLSLPDILPELFLLGGKLVQRLLVAFLFLLILALDAFVLLAGRNIAVLKQTVAGHDIADIVDCGEEAGKAVGAQEEREYVVAAVLLHGAHTGAVARKLLVLKALGLGHFFFLFGYQRTIAPDLLICDGDLLADIGVALVISRLLLDEGRVLLLQLGNLLLAFLRLCGKLFLARLQFGKPPGGVDGIILIGKHAGRQDADHKADEHQHCQQDGDGRHNFFVVQNDFLRVRIKFPFPCLFPLRYPSLSGAVIIRPRDNCGSRSRRRRRR